MPFDKPHGNPLDKTSIQGPSVVLLKRVLPGLAVMLLAVGCAQESRSVSSDAFAGTVTTTDTVDVEFKPVFSLNRPVVGCRLCISLVASGDGDHVGGYVLELRDASGMAIRSMPFNVSTVYGTTFDGTNMGGMVRDKFEVVVSDPPVYESFAVMRDGVELGSVSRSRNAPSISVSGPSSGDVFNDDGTISVSWVGSDADGDDLVYRVYYSTDGGATYRVMFYETKDTSKSLSADTSAKRLRGASRARIGVSVSDGTRSAFAETPIFSVAGHAP